MGHRLTRIYTRTGDDGTTGLAGGKRVPKRSARIAAIGDIDETSSALALVLAEQDVTPPLREILVRIQHELFEIGGSLAMPDYPGVDADDVARLERDLDALNETLPPLTEFVLPGGGRAAAAC
ncbi:MAG: ATP:cob(I)alamin adenosyltransferase, partial [Gammaproteobacteria bacterium]